MANLDVSGMWPKAHEIARWVGSLTDIISANWWIRQFLLDLIGWDPITELIDLFTGEWEAFARNGHAWLSAAGSIDDIRGNVRPLPDCLKPTWGGDAANANYAYIDKLSVPVEHIG